MQFVRSYKSLCQAFIASVLVAGAYTAALGLAPLRSNCSLWLPLESPYHKVITIFMKHGSLRWGGLLKLASAT
jgi:hypothetical protein